MKYYIRSGEFERVVNAPNPYEAAMIALTKARGEQLGHFFYIDERGFRGPKRIDKDEIGEVLKDAVSQLKPDSTEFFEIDTDTLPEFSIKYEDIIIE